METRALQAKWGIGAMLVASILLFASYLFSAAQDQEAIKVEKKTKDSGWKLTAVSALMPDGAAAKARGRIEEGNLVLQSSDFMILEVPLKGITRITRDVTTDYPVAGFIMQLATRPSSEHHRFGSKEYRNEMAARAILGAISFFGLLFPRHREM